MTRGARLFISAVRYRGLISSLAAIVLSAVPAATMATEIKTFRLTDVDSELALRYLFDEQTFYQTGTKTQQDTRPTFQEEYIIDTNSYVFHPNLLSMELGASLLFDQSRYATLDEESSNNEQLLGYNARLDFLKKKAYPVSVYYDKRNPTVSVGLGGRFLQENIKYGTEMALLQPLSPVQVSLTAYRQLTRGEGFDQLIDDNLEHAQLRLYRPYGKGNHAQLSYQIDNRDSRTGSPNLPITSRTTSTTSAYFDSRNIFGGQRQVQLITNASYNTQQEYPKRRELRINPMVDWQHSEGLRSFYRINYNDTVEEDIYITQGYLIGGLGYTGPENNASLDIHAEDNRSSSIDYVNIGSNYMLSHDEAVGTGSIKISYSGSMDYRDQSSADTLFEVFGEEHEMIGTTPVTLKREFVDTASIEVWNTGRTQLYIEGLDYRLLDVGSQTQIQRMSSGNIISGQVVLVDYSYQTGGTFAMDLISNNLRLSWNPSRFYEIYVRYRDSKQKLRKGTPTIQLNSVNSLTWGARADQPFLSGINLGGEFYLENHQEDINPYYRQNYDAYIDLPLPRLTSLRLSARRQIVDNENSIEDVDLTGYIFRLQTRPWLRARLSYESSYETDTGGSLDRTLKIQRFQLGWAFRQLSLTADASYSTEEQGVTDRQRWAIKCILSRRF